jgi:hypothetical protein
VRIGRVERPVKIYVADRAPFLTDESELGRFMLKNGADGVSDSEVDVRGHVAVAFGGNGSHGLVADQAARRSDRFDSGG